MLEKELEVALKTIRSVRQIILDVYNSKDLGVEIKSDNSPVTKADKRADEIIRQMLHEAFPTYGMLTEESTDNKDRLNKEYVWIIDPLDGTKEFVAHTGEFTVNIGLAKNHLPVLGVILVPVTGEIYYGVEGKGSFYLKDENSLPIKIHCNNKTDDLTVLTSRFHHNEKEDELINKHSDVIKHRFAVGATLKGCYIASGKYELSYRCSSGTKEWDTCAMQAVIEQAGGHLLKFDKSRVLYNREDVYNHDGYILINKLDNFLI